jgi:hypothetical protein
VFLRLDPATTNRDLDGFGARENPKTEETIADIPNPGAVTYFWMMGNNLVGFPEFEGLRGSQLARALAKRAKGVKRAGRDGVLPVDYIRKVHEFDPDDTWTAEIVRHL